MTEETEHLNLKDAATMLGYTQMYVRTLVRRGVLLTQKVPLGPASHVWKHMILRSSIEAYMSGRNPGASRGGGKGKSRRADGRRKCFIYLTFEELEKARKLLTDGGITEELNTYQAQIGAYKERKLKAIQKLRKEVIVE